MFRLDGKIAVVTGGAGLIGRVLVQRLAEHGATVLCADNDMQRLEATAASSVSVHPLRMDITSPESVDQAVRSVVERFGKIDAWINNAYPRTADWGLKLEQIPFAGLQKNIDMHMGGYFLCCQRVCEVMKSQRSGSIVNMASIYGVVGPDFSIYDDTTLTMPAAYSLIKGGIIAFTRYLASYYGSHNVRANSISPGGVHDGQDERFVRRYVEKVPLRRMATPDDIAGAAIFLAGDASSYVTGHNLVVDGGWCII